MGNGLGNANGLANANPFLFDVNGVPFRYKEDVIYKKDGAACQASHCHCPSSQNYKDQSNGNVFSNGERVFVQNGLSSFE